MEVMQGERSDEGKERGEIRRMKSRRERRRRWGGGGEVVVRVIYMYIIKYFGDLTKLYSQESKVTYLHSNSCLRFWQ